ncbi:restriction endonuclease subunit S [Microvirga antarctica]|uniref:restriction endonuclease subunit S n=1 Tax=Microvirga antarctica TaxID=2819233 RepID=UPI001FE43393|nr:restriction endonuclease subunit S [Microvirga antarctica]
MATNQGFKSLIPHKNKLDSKYLYHWLDANRARIQSLGNGATFKEITKATVSGIVLPLPSLDEQRRIAGILDRADALRQKRKKATDLLDSLTQSIFLEMFEDSAAAAWPRFEVNELASDIRTGPFGSQLLHSEFVGDGIAVLGIDNAVANTFRNAGRRFITEQKYRSLQRYTVRPGDVLITIMGTCGRCAVVPPDFPIAINTKHLCCITLKREKILPEYLHACFLRHPDVLRQLGVQTKGAVMPGLNMGIIKSLVIPVPPLNLQRKLAALFNTIVAHARRTAEAALISDSLFASLQHRAVSGQL